MAQQQFTCRWAFLSCSSIASVFLPDIILPRDDSDPIKHEIVAISTTGPHERVQKWLTEEHKVPNASSVRIYSSWEEMLRNGDFDIVYISTPHSIHYEQVMAALKNKRNVLVEKPATMTRQQYEILSEEAEKQNVVLMEAMWTRYLPATLYLQKELLPKLGEVRRVYAEFSFPIWSPEMPLSSRFLDKGAGAGALLDQGVYALTWADIALSSIENTTTSVVYANTMPVRCGNNDVDDINTVVLSSTRKDGVQAAVGIITTSMTLTGSNKPSFYHRFRAQKAGPSVRIEGTLGSIAIPFPPIKPEELQVQWYGPDYLDLEGLEQNEVIKKPVERGWGIWYQADVIAKEVLKRRSGGEETKGSVIDKDGSLRVLGWMDQARKISGITYDSKLESTEL